MSTNARTSIGRGRSPIGTAAAVIGFLVAVGWFFAVRHQSLTEQQAQRESALARAGELIELLRQTTRERVKGAAQVLAEDPRLKSTLSAANVDDATILDIVEDLRKLDGHPVFAVLSAEGRVKVVLGAPSLNGLDLASSSVVRGALAQEGAALGVWLVEDRVAEIAVCAVRVGDRPVALLVIGGFVPDAALAKVARTAGVQLSLMVDERIVWSSAASAPTASAGPALRLEVTGSVPPARFVAAPLEAEAPARRLALAVPLLALLFAGFAFWRGGAR